MNYRDFTLRHDYIHKGIDAVLSKNYEHKGLLKSYAKSNNITGMENALLHLIGFDKVFTNIDVNKLMVAYTDACVQSKIPLTPYMFNYWNALKEEDCIYTHKTNATPVSIERSIEDDGFPVSSAMRLIASAEFIYKTIIAKGYSDMSFNPEMKALIDDVRGKSYEEGVGVVNLWLHKGFTFIENIGKIAYSVSGTRLDKNKTIYIPTKEIGLTREEAIYKLSTYLSNYIYGYPFIGCFMYGTVLNLRNLMQKYGSLYFYDKEDVQSVRTILELENQSRSHMNLSIYDGLYTVLSLGECKELEKDVAFVGCIDDTYKILLKNGMITVGAEYIHKVLKNLPNITFKKDVAMLNNKSLWASIIGNREPKDKNLNNLVQVNIA